MKFLLTLMLLSGVYSAVVFAQQSNISPGFGAGITCGVQAGPQDAMEKFEEQWQMRTPQLSASKMLYTLPLVFHVIHDNGAENVSEANILASVANLNLAYANEGYYDQGMGSNVNINFCLAQRTPDKLPTNGITRTVSALTDHLMSRDAELKSLIRWPPLKYINVYVVKEICRSAGDCRVAGFAYYPSSHGDELDGIVVEARYLNGNPENAVLLAHELGHYLGLRHTFEGGCINNDCRRDGDRVCDTPPDGTTTAAPCGTPVNSCTSDTDSGFATDQNDQMNNYMDYNYWSCINMFSDGQIERMIFFLEGTRASLLTSTACLPPCPTPVTANFEVTPAAPLGGQPATLTSTSTNATFYSWLIDGVPAGTSPSLNWTPPAAGRYEITLAAGRSEGNCLPDTLKRFIDISCPFPTTINLPQTLLRAGQDYTLTHAAAGPGAPAAAWSLDGVIVGSTQTLNLVVPEPGFYDLCLRLIGPGCEEESCIRIAVGEPLCAGCPEPDECQSVFQLRFQGPSGSNSRDAFTSVLEDGSRLYAGGAYGNAPLVVATNTVGDIRWQTTLDVALANAKVNRMHLLPGGDLLCFGRLFRNNRASGLLFRLSSEDGALRWAKTYAGSSSDLYFNDLSINATGNHATIVGSIGNRDGMFDYEGYQGLFDLTDGSIVDDRQTANGSTYSTRFQLLNLSENERATVGNYGTISGDFTRTELNFVSTGGEVNRRVIFNATDFLACYAATATVDGIAFLANTSINPAQNRLRVWETDLEGNVRWSKTYNANQNMLAFQIERNSLGFLIYGRTVDNRQVLIQIDENGDFGFARRYDEQLPQVVTPQAILVTPEAIYLPGSDPGRGQSLTKLTTDGRLTDLSCSGPTDFLVTASDASVFSTEVDVETTTVFVIIEDLAGGPANLVLTDEACTAECLEVCDNGVDDDFDGFTDCLDPDLADECCCRPRPTLSLGADSTVCPGYVLRAEIGAAEYRWSDGSTEDFLVIDTEGTYSVSVTDDCGVNFADTITLYLRPRPLWTLGNDTVVCDNAIIPLAGPAGFAAYEWSTGEREQAITAEDFGVFWLTVTDSCGRMTTDSLRIGLDETTAIDLGPDQLICPGESVSFSLTGFSDYAWTESPTLSCADCPEVTIFPETDLLLGVSAASNSGCFTFDTVRIRVADTLGTNTVRVLCQGDTLRVGSLLIFDGGTYFLPRGNENCQAIDTLVVTALDQAFGSDTLTICAGDSILVYDQFVRQAGNYDRFFDDEYNCDSLHRIHLVVNPVSTTNSTLTLCDGDSVLLDGAYRFSSGIFEELFTNTFGCDSVVTTNLTVLDSIVTRETRFISARESVQVFGATIDEPGMYQRLFTSANGCDSLHEVHVERVYPDVVYVPNAFSPNLDGVNDRFGLFPSPLVERVEQLQVLDRWGQQVFEALDVVGTEDNAFWDGMIRGRQAAAGVYVYAYRLRLTDGGIFTGRGNVTLLR